MCERTNPFINRDDKLGHSLLGLGVQGCSTEILAKTIGGGGIVGPDLSTKDFSDERHQKLGEKSESETKLGHGIRKLRSSEI